MAFIPKDQRPQPKRPWEAEKHEGYPQPTPEWFGRFRLESDANVKHHEIVETRPIGAPKLPTPDPALSGSLVTSEKIYVVGQPAPDLSLDGNSPTSLRNPKGLRRELPRMRNNMDSVLPAVKRGGRGRGMTGQITPTETTEKGNFNPLLRGSAGSEIARRVYRFAGECKKCGAGPTNDRGFCFICNTLFAEISSALEAI